MTVDGLTRKALQHIEPREHAAVRLDIAYTLLHLRHKTGVKLAFEGQDGVFRSKYLLLVGLQFLGYIALGVHQSLLAMPLGRHLLTRGVAHFEVVAEHAVIAYLETADAGAFGLAVLQFQQIILAAGGDVAQRIELLAHPARDDLALADLYGRILREGGRYLFEQTPAVFHSLQQLCQRGRSFSVLEAQCLDRLHLLKRPAQLQHFPRQYLAGRCAGNYPFEVAHVFQKAAEGRERLFVFGEMADDIVAVAEGRAVEYGHREPAAQQTCAHGGAAAVEHVYQRHPIASGSALEDLQIAHGEAVHPDELPLFDSRDAADIAESGVFRLLEVD